MRHTSFRKKNTKLEQHSYVPEESKSLKHLLHCKRHSGLHRQKT